MYGFPAAAWSPDSRRIAYAGADGVHVVFADGSKNRRVPTSSAGDYAPAWSPDGSSVAFLHPHTSRTLDLVVVHGRERRLLARRKQDLVFSWSPTASSIAYSTGKPGLMLVTAAGGRHHRLPTTGLLSTFAWSRDGRLLAFVDERALRVLDVASMRVRVLGQLSAYELAWSPDGRRLAFRYMAGVQLADVRTGRVSVLTHDRAGTLSWSPGGSSISYLAAHGVAQADRLVNDLRIVDLRGRSRTVVAANDQFGGSIEASLWTRPPIGVRYRKPTGRPLVVSSNAVAAPWPIDRLVADGNRVAFTACGHLFVWMPSAGSLVQAERSTSLSPACPGRDYATSFHIYDLALAGDRVAYGTVQGGNGRVWSLGGTTLRPRRQPFVLGEGHATNGLAYSGELVGELQGSGVFLAFSAWQEVPCDPEFTRHDPAGDPACSLGGMHLSRARLLARPTRSARRRCWARRGGRRQRDLGRRCLGHATPHDSDLASRRSALREGSRPRAPG
jgi:WD40 repeat protein